MTIVFKTVNTGDIAAGGSVEKEWTADTDITIKKMLLIERGEKALNNVQAYLRIGELVVTRDFVPGSVIGDNLEYCYKPNIAVKRGTRVYCKLVNSRADTVNIDWVTEFEE